jgi:hypothetical protein
LVTFDWQLAPEADKHLHQLIEWFIDRCPQADKFVAIIETVTSTRFFDWVDHITLPSDKLDRSELVEHGFVEASGGNDVFVAPGTCLFPLRFHDSEAELTLKVDDIDAFRSAWSIPREAEGERFAPFRKLLVIASEGGVLTAVERRGHNGFETIESGDIDEYESALNRLRSRKRDQRSNEEGIQKIESMIADLRDRIEPARLADAFARSEIEYWQSRNSAARSQQLVQDELGLGWANQDHLTFRSSRTHFHRLIRLLEVMDFRPRERFYAGAVAGWGAQVLEHPLSSRVIFADVDLAPAEDSEDFAHQPLRELDRRGTVGLWVALHGESILQAGMHHMAVRVDFERARESLLERGIESMTPFSDFTFLRQLFTVGEKWPVDERKLAVLRGSGTYESDRIDALETGGAVGSHMELTQRADGFKGFNQDSVSAIIRATNPLTYKVTQA